MISCYRDFRCAGKECGGVMEDALMAVSTLIEGFYFSPETSLKDDIYWFPVSPGCLDCS